MKEPAEKKTKKEALTASGQPELTLEEAFEKLEEIARQLESEEITLEESFRVYNEGMQLLKYCNGKIDKVEKQVLQLSGEQMTEGRD